jgi:hypothetical protein
MFSLRTAQMSARIAYRAHATLALQHAISPISDAATMLYPLKADTAVRAVAINVNGRTLSGVYCHDISKTIISSDHSDIIELTTLTYKQYSYNMYIGYAKIRFVGSAPIGFYAVRVDIENRHVIQGFRHFCGV